MQNIDWKRLFLSADGRIGRQEFWIGFAILFVAGLVLGMIPVLGSLIGLALIYPQVCIYAKRLHDMGKSGWLMLIPMGIVLVLMIVGAVSGGMAMMGAASGNDAIAGAGMLAGAGLMMGLMGLAMLIGLAFLLWVGLTPSQPGDNRFGPAPGAAAAF